MPNLSDNKDLEFGENYTRGMLCDLMNINYVKDEIERVVYKPPHYSTIIIFSTINNNYGYIFGKLSDTNFIFSKHYLDEDITNHQLMHRELLLFIRNDDRTGYYYFGRCKFSHVYSSPNYRVPFHCLDLLEIRFSDVTDILVPDLL